MGETRERLKDGLGDDRDAFYDALMAAHEGLPEPASHALNARLVLILANEIGDPDRLRALLATAKAYDR